MSLKPAVSVLALALLAACGQDITPPENTATGGEAATAPADATASGVDPSRVDAPAGTAPTLVSEGGYLADASGAALYYLEGNQGGDRCDSACQQVWPPVTLSNGGEPVGGPGVQQVAVGTSRSQAGQSHLTYHGHPLYRYAGDRGARTTTGHDVQDEWGHWRLMGIDGQPGTPSQTQDASGQQSNTRQQQNTPRAGDAEAGASQTATPQTDGTDASGN
jgi:predicted lipoprotein with Yx(FWY)xxD motif